MRYGRDVLYGVDFDSRRSDSANRGLSSGSGSVDPNFHFLHAERLRLLRRIRCNDLGSIRRALPRAFETVLAACRPAENIAVKIGKRHFRIIECRLNEGDSGRNIASAFSPFLRRRSWGCRSRLGLRRSFRRGSCCFLFVFRHFSWKPFSKLESSVPVIISYRPGLPPRLPSHPRWTPLHVSAFCLGSLRPSASCPFSYGRSCGSADLCTADSCDDADRDSS